MVFERGNGIIPRAVDHGIDDPISVPELADL
jgi:hypothetical protein